LIVNSNVVPSSPILVTLMMEALLPSEMSVLTRVAWRNIPEDNILSMTKISYYSKFYRQGFANSCVRHAVIIECSKLAIRDLKGF
jgi:hypothetical protein